jgi:FixJ family two-component response regulator
MTDDAPSFVVAVVDDDERILKPLGDLLESAEYAVLLFTSAAALLESDCLARIDCLISDMGMPEMDGIELSQAARAIRPGLPIILITGRADLLNRSSIASLGCYRLFRKPFDGEALLEAVGDALRNPRPSSR